MSSDDVVTDTIAAVSAAATTEEPIEAESVDLITFELGEKVLAFHNSCLYDAKVREVQTYSDGQSSYYVHYLGWKKKWDEWLFVDRLLKHTTQNLERQKELKRNRYIDKNVNTGHLSHDKPKRSIGLRGKKRQREATDKDVAVSPLKKFNISIPPPLKKQLVDDFESITKLSQLVKLPRSPNVHEILNKYFDHRMKKDVRVDAVSEIVKGLNHYFDKALPTVLLYRNERQQYEEVIEDDISPSIVYGAEHLLRLFVKLPEMLSSIQIEMEAFDQLKEISLDFLRFLQINTNEFFLSSYQTSDGLASSTKNDGD